MNIIIQNVIITEKNRNGVLRGYDLAPAPNYVIHDKTADGMDEDGNIIYRYSTGSCSVGINYDFDNTTTLQVPDANGNLITVTAYGSREFFALPANSVPENEIYGGGDNNNEHEKI